MTALQELDLHGWEQLSALPDSLGKLTALQELDLSGCKKLSALPDSLTKLTALQTLNLDGCEKLSTLPESLGKLTALHWLELMGCTTLSALPESLGELTALQMFTFTLRPMRSPYEMSWPKGLGQLTALRWLKVDGRMVDFESSFLLPEFGQLMTLPALQKASIWYPKKSLIEVEGGSGDMYVKAKFSFLHLRHHGPVD